MISWTCCRAGRCSLIRSKNAGPFVLTFDLICRDEAAYHHLTTNGALTAETFASIYQLDPVDVRLYLHDPDCYGQQHSLLLDLQIDA